jgi:hypothetical protein
MFLNNSINISNFTGLIISWIQNKVCGAGAKNKAEEPANFTGIDTDDHEHLKYTYEMEHYGADYHDKVGKFQDFVKMENALDREATQVATVEIIEALLILGIQSRILTSDDINTAYYQATAKYCPECTPAWLEMRKMIAIAHNILISQRLHIVNKVASMAYGGYNYAKAINTALNKIINLQGVSITVRGTRALISDSTKDHGEILKQSGFRQGKKTYWTFSPIWKHKITNNKT